ncbi:hypothetical protein AB0L13_21900 [Saccharopolyspora shandongensis]|uniref:hypothetical protein n=1 Tax=Saccharopolyspora shandongensis TaxID=418495 RepID=UPI00341F4811
MSQPLREGHYKEYLPTPAPPQELGEEQILDLEAVHTMAPDADLAYVATRSPSPGDMFDGLAKVVDQHLADVVSGSWFLGVEPQMSGDVIASYQRLFQFGAVEGIGFAFASGDDGDFSKGGWGGGLPSQVAVQYPASDPWVTAVGGTSLVLDKNGTYQYETGWGVARNPYDPTTKKWSYDEPGVFYVGAGGGTSHLFDRPSYQRNISPSGPVRRQIPDVAADAVAFTGLAVGYLDHGSYKDSVGLQHQ